MLISALLSFAVCAASAPAPSVQVAHHDLRVEMRTNPVGLDVSAPRFSWLVDDSRRGARQSAYRILVASDEAVLAKDTGDLWDSGRVSSRDTNQVVYAGRELLPFRTYHWKVCTWDLGGVQSSWSERATWTMGPMRATDWTAKWIEVPTSAPAIPAATPRLGYHSAWMKNENDFAYVQIDFGAPTVFDGIRLHPARPDGDPKKKGVLFPLQVKIYGDDYEQFDLHFQKLAEYTWQDIPNAGAEPLPFDLITRFKLRYVRIVVEKMQKGEGGYGFALGELEVLDGTNNIAPRGTVSAANSLEEGGWTLGALNDGQFLPPKAGAPIAATADEHPGAILRKPFRIDAKPKRAFLFASALGLYECSLNGEAVGDARLAPGWTDYSKRVPYQAYDVTTLVHWGDNAMSATMADGWYAGRIGLTSIVKDGPKRAIYGSRPRFLAQLVVETEDNKLVRVGTDASWIWTDAGPVRSADLLDGETFDGRREILRASTPNFTDPSWRPVAESKFDAPKLFAQISPPVRPLQEVPASSVTEPKPGVFVYDFGQNLTGVVRIRLYGENGTVLTLRHGEALNDDGTLYTENLRSAAQTDHYIQRGTPDEVFDPHFTTHGFRFVEITGAKTAIPIGAVTAISLRLDTRLTASFECSDPLLNDLWRNILWTQLDNTVGLPTDCPQRDERLGWLGDIQVFAQTACFNADMATFFEQWLGEVRSAQTSDGRFPDFAPHPFDPGVRFRGAPAWGDAGVFVPWTAYLNYHDLRLLTDSVDSMLRWVDFVHSKNPDLLWKNERGNDYGDWLNGDLIKAEGWKTEGHEVPKEVLATACFARSAELAAKAAFAVSRPMDAKRMSELANEVKAAWRKAYVDAEGKIQGDTQAGYALAVDFHLLGDDPHAEAQAVEHLARRIEQEGALTTGIVSTARAMLALSRHGKHELALSLARKKTFPSWGYAIEHGATTIWERWDSFVKDRGFQDPVMNSFNHYAFGAVGEWMMRTIAGIEIEDRHPTDGPVTLTPQTNGPTQSSAPGPRAFEHVTLRPQIAGGLTWAKASHESIAGHFATDWKLEGDAFAFSCEIPPNSSATLFLPAKDRDSIQESGKALGLVTGATFTRMNDGLAEIELGSGSYQFTSKLR